MNFKNISISSGITFFTDQILKTYPHLKVKYNPREPCIFFGIYTYDDIINIMNHKSYGLIIWGGSDAMNPQLLDFVKQLDKSRFFSIAQSKWVADDLKKAGIPYKQLPWYSLNKKKFKAVKKGKKIYIYMPTQGMGRQFYGYNLFMAIKQKVRYEIIVGDGKIPYEKMPETYAQCFVGLRLVPHDGLGSTVQEMGLMGIKCIHNGNSPSALNFKTIQDIVQHIENEAKKIGTKDEEMAKIVDEYLTIPDNFFNISTYFN